MGKFNFTQRYKETSIINPTDGLIIDEVGSNVPKRISYSDFTESVGSSVSGSCGYSHTGAFAGKPLSNSYVWEAGQGINYSQTDVNNEIYKVLSLDNTVHFKSFNLILPTEPSKPVPELDGYSVSKS